MWEEGTVIMKCIVCGKRASNPTRHKCWQDKQQCANCYYGGDTSHFTPKIPRKTILYHQLKEYTDVMATEPEGSLIELKTVYHNLRRMMDLE